MQYQRTVLQASVIPYIAKCVWYHKNLAPSSLVNVYGHICNFEWAFKGTEVCVSIYMMNYVHKASGDRYFIDHIISGDDNTINVNIYHIQEKIHGQAIFIYV